MTCRTIKHKHNAPRAQHQNRIAKAAADLDPLAIFNLLLSRELGEVMEQHLPAHQERHFPPRVTLAMFIGQALSEDGSLQRAVDQWAVQSAWAGLTKPSTHTGAYCRAWQRLSSDLVRALCEHMGEQLHAAAEPAWRWHGRPVKLVDGAGLSMPDTQAIQARGIDLVGERHGSRRTDFRRGCRLGARDHIIEWSKPAARPSWMTVS